MYGKTNKIPAQLDSLNSKLEALKEQQSFTHAQAVIDEIVALFGVNSAGSWSLINDSRGKIKANANWFEMAEGFADRRATYKLAENNDKNIDFKTFWVQKPSKSIVSWIVALTPNFEDEPYNVNKNLGIDFIIPKKSDKVIIALSNNYIIRTLELDGTLTPTQQNILIKWTQPFDFANKSQLHQILWDSFDLEPVNKEFYKEISSYFVELKQHLLGLDLFDEKHAAYFSSRLIGRLIFCWFIDKKGFINPEMKYFDVSQDSTNYYHNKLEKLFFATLNTPLEERGVKFESVQSNLFSSHKRKNNLFNIGVDMVTPFLNGGLFEERETDFVGNKNLTFPTDYFHRLIQTLNHYNFTTDESTSSFQQVAIDPEMLGRIFENLLAEQSEETGEQARKAKGAFYTPREIVDYMCRESLREYLKTKIPYDEMRDSKLELLLDKKSHEYRDQQKNFRQYLKNYKSDIIDALDDLKILDPACGSGAFPMGMLQLLVQVYERLEPRFDQYETKVAIVKNNIYGVDIEPMAVEISRLRTWLSIIVDEEIDSNKVKPLPNLDFKFVCANSLIPLDQNGAQGLLDDSDLEEKLVEIREKYFNARTHNSKKNLKDKLNKLIGYSSNGKQLSGFKSNRQLQLESYQPFNPENSTAFFDSFFMFGIDNFDLVIGNPPYIRVQGIDKNLTKFYKSNYESATGKYDLYVVFTEMALKHINADGVVNFIMPHKWINGSFGKGLRKLTSKKLYKFISFSDYPIFSASTYTSLVFFKQKSNDIEYTELDYSIKTKSQLNDFLQSAKFNKVTKISNDNLSGDTWMFANSEIHSILEKLKENGSQISDYFNPIFMGIVTGYDKAFYVTGQISGDYLVQGDAKIEKTILKPVIKSKSFKRFEPITANQYIIFPHYKDELGKTKPYEEHELKEKFPLAFAHLLKFKDILSKKKIKYGVDPKKWYTLHNSREINYFEQTKIVTPYLSKGSNFSLDTNNTYFSDANYGLILKEKSNKDYLFYLAILNSDLFWFFIKNTSAVFGGGYYYFKSNYLKPFPLPKNIDVQIMDEISTLSGKIIDSKMSKTQSEANEDKINQIIYNLYQLTSSEVKIIKESITK